MMAIGSKIIQNQPMRSAVVREMASRMNMAYHTLRVTCHGLREPGLEEDEDIVYVTCANAVGAVVADPITELSDSAEAGSYNGCGGLWRYCG